MAEIIDIDEARESAKPRFGIRPLRAKDIAPMARIIGKIGLKEFAAVLSPASISALVGRTDEGELRPDIVGVGIMLDVSAVVCENFDKAEKDLFGFMASLSGLTVKEVESLSLADTFELLHAICTAGDFADFFKRVRSLLAS